tara:strand:- start:429 stop:659 length:231 start_codon:yes stop_codon:yes gene_type:complete
MANNKKPEDNRYQQCITDIFDYVRHVCLMEGLSMEEALGVLTVVRGSIEINIAIHKMEVLPCENELPLEEDEDHDE